MINTASRVALSLPILLQRSHALLDWFLNSFLLSLAQSRRTLLPIPRDFHLLHEIDRLYALPLLVAVLSLLIVGLWRKTVSPWMAALVAFMYVLPSVALPLFPDLLVDDSAVSDGASLRLFSVFFGSLLLVWLLSGRLSRMRPLRAGATTAAILAVGSVLGMVTRPLDPVVTAAYATFIVVVIGSFVLARAFCRRHYSRKRFMILLLIFNVVTMLQVWPSFFWIVLVGVFSIPPAELLRQALFPLFGIALIDGIGLFVCLVPFMLVAFFAAPHPEHFSRIMHVEALAD